MIDTKFLKDWGLSLLADVGFIVYVALAIVLNTVIIGSLPLMRFISKYTLDEVTQNPALLPSKFTLYSNVVLLFLVPLLFIIGGYLVFVLTRQLFYTGNTKNFRKSALRMLLGFFTVFVPLYLGLFVLGLIVKLFTFGNIYIYQIVMSFFISVLLIMCGTYFVKSKDESSFKASSNTYDSLVQNTKKIAIGAGIITAASFVFMLFGTLVLSRRYLYQGFSDWWYIITSLLMISWLRVYVVQINEKESFVKNVVKKAEKAVKTTVKRVRKKVTKVKKAVKKRKK